MTSTCYILLVEALSLRLHSESALSTPSLHPQRGLVTAVSVLRSAYQTALLPNCPDSVRVALTVDSIAVVDELYVGSVPYVQGRMTTFLFVVAGRVQRSLALDAKLHAAEPGSVTQAAVHECAG